MNADEFLTEYVHRGVDLAALATKHNLRLWRCGVCGQEEMVPINQEPKPCWRCYINSGESWRDREEMQRLGDAKRARLKQGEE